MSLESQLGRCHRTLEEALEHAAKLRDAVASGAVRREDAYLQEAKLVALMLSGLVDLGLDVSDLPALERIAAVLRYWTSNVRLILTLLPNEGTGERRVKPWLVGGEPWNGA